MVQAQPRHRPQEQIMTVTGIITAIVVGLIIGARAASSFPAGRTSRSG
jgi:hypothetical protein